MNGKKRVLIVDDEVGFTRLLRLNLQHVGRYHVEVVNDAAQALGVAREFRPDVVLLDVMMPSMDGGEVARQFQANPVLRSTPIIFLTAAVKKSEVDSHQGLIGGLTFISKPVDLHDVIASIEKQLSTPVFVPPASNPQINVSRG